MDFTFDTVKTFEIAKDGKDAGDTKDDLNIDIDTKSESTNKLIDTCVIGITTHGPYDTSKFVNNSTTYYTRITYLELFKLYDLINFTSDKSKITKPETTETETTKPETTESDITKSTESDTTKSTESDVSVNVKLLYIANCFKDSQVKMIFRFLCSSDCANGNTFIDQETTSKVYEFVRLVTKNNCIVEVSDHSMGSFFNNWNPETMGIPNPIEILPITHSGSFKMYGNKNDFINSTHPTLKQIGDLSSVEQVEITFNNMGGTKVYKIIGSNVKVISKGIQIKDLVGFRFEYGFENIFKFGQKEQEKSYDLYEEVPVHCEFDYQNGKIVVSATHWCNLNSVENPIDLPTLRRYCTNSLGEEATQDLETSLSSALNENEYKRIISTTVRQISCGTNSFLTKKIKIDHLEKTSDIIDLK
jgi:hypothetical protein